MTYSGNNKNPVLFRTTYRTNQVSTQSVPAYPTVYHFVSKPHLFEGPGRTDPFFLRSYCKYLRIFHYKIYHQNNFLEVCEDNILTDH